ncbi:MAG: hypothetical protein LUE96_04865 [Lachnospiraceae bacterium]|nr:hypothetical protein [Lachnospiraceae bacterium]
MEELYAIMEDLLEAEYNQQSLLRIMSVAEAAYNEEQQAEAKYVANSVKYYLEALQRELEGVTGRLDSYLTKRGKNER